MLSLITNIMQAYGCRPAKDCVSQHTCYCNLKFLDPINRIGQTTASHDLLFRLWTHAPPQSACKAPGCIVEVQDASMSRFTRRRGGMKQQRAHEIGRASCRERV